MDSEKQRAAEEAALARLRLSREEASTLIMLPCVPVPRGLQGRFPAVRGVEGVALVRADDAKDILGDDPVRRLQVTGVCATHVPQGAITDYLEEAGAAMPDRALARLGACAGADALIFDTVAALLVSQPEFVPSRKAAAKPGKPLTAAEARQLYAIALARPDDFLLNTYPQLSGATDVAIILAGTVKALLGAGFVERLRRTGIAVAEVDARSSFAAGHGAIEQVILDREQLNCVASMTSPAHALASHNTLSRK